MAYIDRISQIVADLLAKSDIADDQFHIAAGAIFERLMVLAPFTKHRGFSEEKEWRVVYLSTRDEEKKLAHMLGYSSGSRGIEPKLKFKVAAVEGVTSSDLSFEEITSAILLGPTMSSPLAHRSVARMLDLKEKPALKNRLFASSIPFRQM